MHRHFGEWYRSAGIPPDSVPLEKRWQAVEAFDVDANAITSLTQVFHKLSLTDSAFPETFRTAFQDKDPAFQMSGNDRELIVLAGAALVDSIERSPREEADLAGLCLVCASVQNVRQTPAVPEIPEIAAKYLSERCVGRATPEDDGPEVEWLKKLTSLGDPYDKLASEFHKLQLQLPVVAEESDILWWLESRTSRDLDTLWSKMSPGAVCLVAGTELADLTRVVPGPLAARAFLDRTLRFDRNELPPSISIADVVNHAAKPWREKHYQKPLSSELGGILPINQAVRLSLQAPDDDAWQPLFETSTGIQATAKTRLSLLAYQVFLEHLTERCFLKASQSQ